MREQNAKMEGICHLLLSLQEYKANKESTLGLHTVARWPNGLLLGIQKVSKPTLHCFLKWPVDGVSIF